MSCSRRTRLGLWTGERECARVRGRQPGGRAPWRPPWTRRALRGRARAPREVAVAEGLAGDAPATPLANAMPTWPPKPTRQPGLRPRRRREPVPARPVTLKWLHAASSGAAPGCAIGLGATSGPVRWPRAWPGASPASPWPAPPPASRQLVLVARVVPVELPARARHPRAPRPRTRVRSAPCPRAGPAGYGEASHPRGSRLLAAGGERGLGHEIGKAGTHALDEPRVLTATSITSTAAWPYRVARWIRLSSSTPSTCGSSAGSMGSPMGSSWVRQADSRPSRSTIRSTAIFAIRRHVVSLPP